MPRQTATATARLRNKRTRSNAKHGLGLLPAELRNHIWELVVPSDIKYDTSKRLSIEQKQSKRREEADQYALRLRAAREVWPRDSRAVTQRASLYVKDVEAYYEAYDLRSGGPITPAITQVCTAFRQETLGLFFGSNIFELRTTSQDVQYDVVEWWVSSRPTTALQAMRRLVVNHVVRTPNGVGFCPLSIDLGTGIVDSVRGEDSPVDHHIHPTHLGLSVVKPPWGHNVVEEADWPEGSSTWRESGSRVGVAVSAAEINKRVELARRLHQFGVDGVEMTPERLMAIVKAFNFYRKDSYKKPTPSTEEDTIQRW